MTNSELLHEIGVFNEGQLVLIREKMRQATPEEASQLWGQMMQCQKMKTLLAHYQTTVK